MSLRPTRFKTIYVRDKDNSPILDSYINQGWIVLRFGIYWDKRKQEYWDWVELKR